MNKSFIINSMKSVQTVSLIIIISLIGLFGVAFLNAGMEHGDMTNPCPYSQGMNSMCPMTIAHHVTMWLSLFRATPQHVMVITLMIVVVCLISSKHLRTFFTASPPVHERFFLRVKLRNPEISMYQYLLTFFRTGVLHPKVF